MNIILLPGQYGNKYSTIVGVLYKLSYLLQWHYCMRGLDEVIWQQPRVIEKKNPRNLVANSPKTNYTKYRTKLPLSPLIQLMALNAKLCGWNETPGPAIRLLRNFCSRLCGVSTILTSNFTERYQSSIQSVNQNDFFVFFSSAVGNLFHMFVLKE